MSSQLKSVLYRVIIISFAMLVINLIVGWIFDVVYPKPNNHNDLDARFFVQIEIQDYLQIILLVLSALWIAKGIPNLKYWKIALALVGMIVLHYHLTYFYYLIDYYWIKGLTPKPEKQGLEMLRDLFSFEPRPPSYEPINHLLDWQLLLYGRTPGISFENILIFVYYGTVSRVLWVGAAVFFFLRRKQKGLMNNRK